MLFSKLLYLLPCTMSLAAATPADDMRRSADQINAVCTILNNSLNNTAALNTSSMIQSLSWQIGASIANLAQYNSTQQNPTTPTYDAPYFNYIDSILTLSEALIRRGQITHSEPNQPVYSQLQGLYNVIQAYGFQLNNDDAISTAAVIRTLTAGNSLVDAESIWARNITATSNSLKKGKRGVGGEK